MQKQWEIWMSKKMCYTNSSWRRECVCKCVLLSGITNSNSKERHECVPKFMSHISQREVHWPSALFCLLLLVENRLSGWPLDEDGSHIRYASELHSKKIHLDIKCWIVEVLGGLFGRINRLYQAFPSAFH